MREYAALSLRVLAALTLLIGFLMAGALIWAGRNMLGLLALPGVDPSIPTAALVFIILVVIIATFVTAMLLVVISYAAEDLYFVRLQTAGEEWDREYDDEDPMQSALDRLEEVRE